MIPIKDQLLAAFSIPHIIKPQVTDNMARPKTNHRKLAMPDEQGRIRQVVGYTQDGKKARFQIADRNISPAEASKRLNLIQLLYEKQCERFKVDFWQRWTQRIAVKIGKGEPILDRCIGHSTVHQAGVVEQLKAWGIPIVVTEEHKYAEGVAKQKEDIVKIVQQVLSQSMGKVRRRHGALAETLTLPGDPLILTETATFYDALDAYRDHINATGKRDKNNKLTTNCRQRIQRTKYLKEHHSDIPLWKLDLPQLEKLAAYWRNRPATKKSDRCSKEHARDMLKETWRFLRWLDKQPNYRWLLPRGADEIKRSPISLPDDNRGQAFQTITKETYTPEQLAIIAQFTDAFGRALIGVCVNCAFGQSEIGQWPTSKFVLNKAHPHADKLGIDSTDADSWIVGNRPKTGVYGEHLLWPQVASALALFLDGREVFPITGRQTPWYKTHSANPQATFTNWWRDLMDQVLKVYPDLMYLPFGSLRDSLPDLLRTRFSDDVASLALQHGNLSDDSLLKHYANHPYGRLFVATRELELHFKPFLDALSADVQGGGK